MLELHFKAFISHFCKQHCEEMQSIVQNMYYATCPKARSKWMAAQKILHEIVHNSHY